MALLTNINGKFSVSDAGAVTFNNAFTFPTADGTANYVLKTNGSGQLAWAADNYENYDYWILQGDSAANVNINSTNTLKFVGGTYMDANASWAGGSNPRKLTINHETTSRTDTTSTDAPAFGGTFEAVTSVTTNTTGHVTAIDVSTVTIPTDPGGTVKGTGTATRVAFWSASDTITSDADLYWDNTNKRLGIGTTTPLTKLEIKGTASTRNALSNILTINGGENVSNPYDGFGVGAVFKGRDYSNALRDYAYIYGVIENQTSSSTPAGDPGFKSQLRFYTNTGGTSAALPTQKMVINALGNVGIGGTPSTFANYTNVTIQGGSSGSNLDFKNSSGTRVAAIVSNPSSDFGIETNEATPILFKTNDTERIRIESTGVMKFANTATSTGDVGTIAHYTNNYMYIRGGTGGLAIGDDGFGVSIYLNNSDSIQFSTGGTEKMRINSQGQMWLGGSYTGSNIANGNATYMNNLNAGSFSILHRNSSDVYVHFNSYYTSSNTYVSKYSGRGFMLGYNAAADNGFFFSKAPNTTAGQNQTFSQIMTVGYGTDNNVGIGTTSPGNKLTVKATNCIIDAQSTGDGQTIGFRAGYLTNADLCGLFRYTTGDAQLYIDNNFTGNNAVYSDINFRNKANGGTTLINRMKIKGSTGNVGIGDETPDYRLTVAKTSQAAPAFMVSGAYYGGPRIQTYGLDADANAWMGLGTDMSGGAYEHNIYFSDYNSNGRLSIGTYNGTTYSEKMCVLRTGYVGIGTTNPSYKCVISNSGAEGLELGPGYVSGANLLQNYNRSNSQYVRADYVASIHRWYQGNTSTVNIHMDLTGSGVLTVKNDIVAYGSPSDKRLKENIKPIESALDKVSKLQGVTFDWKKSDSILDIKEDIGFIAQDVQKVIPELVRENEDGMLSMRHQGIAPILLEAIKELKAEIEELKKHNCNCNK